MLAGLEGILALACSALCCLFFVLMVFVLAFVVLRKKDVVDDDGPSELLPPLPEPEPAAAPAPVDRADAPTVRAPVPAEPDAVTVRATPPGALLSGGSSSGDIPSTRSVSLSPPPLTASPSATIIPPDDWIDDLEDDATLLVPKKGDDPAG